MWRATSVPNGLRALCGVRPVFHDGVAEEMIAHAAAVMPIVAKEMLPGPANSRSTRVAGRSEGRGLPGGVRMNGAVHRNALSPRQHNEFVAFSPIAERMTAASSLAKATPLSRHATSRSNLFRPLRYFTMARHGNSRVRCSFRHCDRRQWVAALGH